MDTPRIFPNLRYRDGNMALRWLTDVVGFTLKTRHDAEDGQPAHAEL